MSLSDILFFLAVACCVVAQAAILRSALQNHPATPDTAHLPRPRTGAEVAWALLPAFALALVLAVTWRAMHRPVHMEHMRVSAQAGGERER